MSKLYSLSDLSKKQEEEDKKRNEYYAGGNDSRTGGGSGLSVMDPRDPDRSSGGGAHRETLSRIVENAQSSSGGSTGTPPTGGRRVTLYRNGFTVDDGPLRDLESPESRRFLSALAEGFVPQELIKDNKAVDVAIELSDKRSEDYEAPPPPAYVAFGGEAMSLGRTGASSATIITSEILSRIIPPDIDPSAAVTTIQVKLLSGKKTRIRLNHSHTVEHLLTLILREEPTTKPFILSSGFPPKDINNIKETISEAGLLGALLGIGEEGKYRRIHVDSKSQSSFDNPINIFPHLTDVDGPLQLPNNSSMYCQDNLTLPCTRGL
eukprot:gene7415-15149_t